MNQGTCAGCGREGCAINADGTVRYHLTDNPEAQATPGSRKCKGAGQAPAGTEQPVAEAAEPKCRVCKNSYPLTANGRIRSHLSTAQPGPDGKQLNCPGGSDFPLGDYPDIEGPTSGSAEAGSIRLGDLDEGDYFIRNGALMRLAERESRSSVLAEVLNGPHKGRTSELRNLDEIVQRVPEHHEDESGETHRGRYGTAGDIHPGSLENCHVPTCQAWCRVHPDSVYCEQCNYDTHRCPGCGTDVPHGTVACADCDPEPKHQLTGADPVPARFLTEREKDGQEHRYNDGNGGTWIHAGRREDCRAPECDQVGEELQSLLSEVAGTVPGMDHEHDYIAWDDLDEDGQERVVQACRICRMPEPCAPDQHWWVYGDDDNGHSGDVCDVCWHPEELMVECACGQNWNTHEDMRAAGHGDMICPADEGSEEPCDSSPTRSASPTEPPTSLGPDQPSPPRKAASASPAPAGSLPEKPSATSSLDGGSTTTAGTPGYATATPSDDWRTPADLLDRMPENIRNIVNAGPVCGGCGHPVTPLVDRFGTDGRPEVIVWGCEQRCRHECVPHLEFAVLVPGDEFQHRGSWMKVTETDRANRRVTATVLSKGRWYGTKGTVQYQDGDLTEVRRKEATWTRSATEPTRQVPGQSSTPGTTASATSATNPSTREISSVPSGTANTPTPSARRTDNVTTETKPELFDNGGKPATKEFDGYGRYILPDPTGTRKAAQKYTRCTTFAKSISDTYALSMWSQRMVIKGMMLRDDLRAMAVGLHERTDKDKLNSLAEDAKKAAGDKISANLGTAIHGFTENVDNGEPLKDVPADYQPMVVAYQKALEAQGLKILPGMIERKTAVPQYGVAGKFDRVYLVTQAITLTLPNKKTAVLKPGDLVVGDVKGLALTEKIPTPDGWTTMGDVRVGDTVFDAYGKPCKVTLKSKVKRIGTYIVRFDDRSSVVCDREHIWWTAEGNRPGEPTAKGIEEIISTLSSSRGQKHHRVPVAGALELPEADLPIDPYLLGCWLGDGAKRGGTITKGRDLFEILENDGHQLGVEQTEKGNCITRTVLGLRTALRNADLLHNKHIPAQYLRASVDQRTALLRGLMDTDGSWNTARLTAEFSTCDKALALQVEELLLSLGQRPYLSCVNRTGFGMTVESYTVEFTPVDVQTFRLPRKADQAAASNKRLTRSRRRVIVAVEPGPDVETACIGVDSPTHTYLCGDRMIPTHNTGRDLDYGWGEISIQLTLYAHGVNESGVFNEATRTWGKVDGRVREDVGIVMHMPVQREPDAPLCTMYALDLEEGWKAAELCHAVREWRKNRNLATPLEVVEAVPESPAELLRDDSDDQPGSALIKELERETAGVGTVADAVTIRQPTWEERFRAVTTRQEASDVYQEARRHLQVIGGPAELNRLVGLAQAKLRSLVEPGG